MTRPRLHARVAAVLTIAAVALPLLLPAATVAQSGPVKIGMLAPLTGPFAQIGKDMVEDRDAFLAALKKVELKDTARGPLSVDRWGNPVQNIYIRKVERVGGKLQNTVIATIPSVGQFWKFNPDEYMKLPLYSRDYPPCKHC